MNIKKTTFLALMLVLTAGLSQAMAPADSQILDSVETVTYNDSEDLEIYKATLADGTSLGFFRQKSNNLIGSLLPLDRRNNFASDVAIENGFRSLRKKYNEQDPSFKLTQ